MIVVVVVVVVVVAEVVLVVEVVVVDGGEGGERGEKVAQMTDFPTTGVDTTWTTINIQESWQSLISAGCLSYQLVASHIKTIIGPGVALLVVMVTARTRKGFDGTSDIPGCSCRMD